MSIAKIFILVLLAFLINSNLFFKLPIKNVYLDAFVRTCLFFIFLFAVDVFLTQKESYISNKYRYMERDLVNISRSKRLKNIASSDSAKKIEPCLINGKKLIIKTHRKYDTYNNEKNAYILLKNEDFLPELIYFDDKNLKLCITDVGDSLPNIKNINLKDYEEELIGIIDIMQHKYNIYHNDLRPKNICIDKNNKIKLIDFDESNSKPLEDKYIFRSKDRIYDFNRFYF